MWNAWYRGITHAVLVVKAWPKKQLRRARPRWDNTVRVVSKKWQCVDWLRLAQTETRGGLSWTRKWASAFREIWKFLNQLNNCQLLKGSVQWSPFVMKVLRIKIIASIFCRDSPRGPRYVNLRGFDITFRNATFGRVLWKGDRPVAKMSTWEHAQHSQQTSMGKGAFEPAIPTASQRPLTHARDRAATGMGFLEIAPLSNALRP